MIKAFTLGSWRSQEDAYNQFATGQVHPSQYGSNLTYNRRVSRQMESKYGKAINSSWGISPPAFNLASLISARTFSCTSRCWASSWNVCASALVVVSVAANTKRLSHWHWKYRVESGRIRMAKLERTKANISVTYDICPSNSSSESLSSSEAFIFSRTVVQVFSSKWLLKNWKRTETPHYSRKILMISFPFATCSFTAASPASSAAFFSKKTRLVFSYTTSVISLRRWIPWMGTRSKSQRRNHLGPSFLK